jgi:uncharacterized protein (DUF488 family)
MSATVFSLGYERAGLDQVIALLRAEKIDTLVDIRELPNSRRAGFAKRQLSAGLEEAGIAYRHIKALGTPKAGRDANKRGDLATFETIYAATLDQPAAQLAVVELAELAGARRLCLMCFEHDWRRCHRAMVCEALAGMGVGARHLEVGLID